MSSWNYFFVKNSKSISHIYNQLRNIQYIPPVKNVFKIFSYIDLEKVKVVIVGDEPYNNENEISDIAIATKKTNIVPPKLLRNIYANLENHIKAYKPISNHHFDQWLDEGIFLCNFCFTRPRFQSTPKSYYLLWEPFINNLIEFIFNDHPVVFMLFDSIDSFLRKFINESKCSVVTIPHPIKKYYQFKNSNCFVEAQQLACNLGYTFKW
ncbi:DNA glycosylase [Neocallimastix californiae]|uniref:DNA glycosylase n=1 Tax=Neocallimastix californiae TaxID=1754190 RepID=A0A1Y2AIR9_9FUNG|nr:DNA glycosylase [Neocallimastix californiae]|eukprot:ORY22087.1 DNA glycosylase [Neocallimastix californiae]